LAPDVLEDGTVGVDNSDSLADSLLEVGPVEQTSEDYVLLAVKGHLEGNSLIESRVQAQSHRLYFNFIQDLLLIPTHPPQK
jgi:hypothetical protein